MTQQLSFISIIKHYVIMFRNFHKLMANNYCQKNLIVRIIKKLWIDVDVLLIILTFDDSSVSEEFILMAGNWAWRKPHFDTQKELIN
jgi:hypothetical protein